MTREEMVQIIQPVREIFTSGKLLGCAYFAKPSFDEGVSLGSGSLSKSGVGIAIYRIIQASGYDVERVCKAVIMLARSEASRN